MKMTIFQLLYRCVTAPYIPLHVSQPQHFYILALCCFITSLFRVYAAEDSECPSGHLGGEVWIYPRNYCSLAARRVINAFIAFLKFYFSLCHGRLMCFLRYSLSLGHVWSDSRTQSLPITTCSHRIRTCRCIHILPFPTISHLWPPSTPKIYS